MGIYFMGIDHGSTIIKSGIFDENGNEIAVAGSKVKTYSPHPGWYECDMVEIWEASKSSISEAIRRSGVNPRDIIALSLTGHGNGAHLVDQRGNGVRRKLLAMDDRGSEYVYKWTYDGTYSKIHPLTLQSLWPGLAICDYAWFLNHEPESLEKTKWLLSAKDFIRLKLTGSAYLDYSDASGSGILNAYTKKVDTDVLQFTGLSGIEDKFPEIRHATAKCGRITKEAADATGLKEGTLVSTGSFDSDTIPLATGVTNNEYLSISMGSWIGVKLASKIPVEHKNLFGVTSYVVDDYFLISEGRPTGTVNLEWFIQTFILEKARHLNSKSESVFNITNDAVANTKVQESNIIFLPFTMGNLMNDKSKGCFLGIEAWHERKHMIRAIYEGISFTAKWLLDNIDICIDGADISVPPIARIAGGAARSKQWMQMVSDIINRPLETTYCEEVGTLGAAMFAAVCSGHFHDLHEAASAMVKIKERIEPLQKNVPIYAEKYDKFLDAVAKCSSYFNISVK